MVGGAGLTQELLAGLVDELRIDIMPVFLGDGFRLFDRPALEGIRLEKLDVQDVGARSSLRFRVVKQAT